MVPLENSADELGVEQAVANNRSVLERLFGSRPEMPRPVRKVLALCSNLLSERGEVSGTRLATETLDAYRALSPAERNAFLDRLATEFSPNPDTVSLAAEAYRREPSPKNLTVLQLAAEPLRRELFRRLNLAPAGTAQLVSMRRQILLGLSGHKHWQPVAADLEHLFSAWFNRGFLVLQRIDWRTSALVLEKLIQYEAVHEIKGWTDLRRRLAADRRCYAFFHPALPDEPIIFIEVALTNGISTRVQPLLDPDSPVLDANTADSAIFYSITNCQEGLRGVPFGSFLIKQVVEDLSRNFPRLRKFSTLSPVPGFRAWLERTLPIDAKLSALAGVVEDSTWIDHPELRIAMEQHLMPLCAYYLLHAKQGREPLDSVARFHLKNGARLERINWLGDTSPVGMDRSCGIMVNYLYRLSEVERNHELYTREDRVNSTYAIAAAARKITERK